MEDTLVDSVDPIRRRPIHNGKKEILPETAKLRKFYNKDPHS